MPRPSIVVLLALALGDAGGLAALPRAQAQAVDQATEAMRREVEAEIRKQKAIWARLRKLPAAPGFAPAFGEIQIVEGHVLMSDDYICMWIFGAARTDVDRRDYLDLLLAARIDQANRQRALTEAERRTLQLAGQGDIKRFLDRVMETRQRDRSADGLQIELSEYQAFEKKVGELQMTFRHGPFGEGSLYSKALNTIRTDGLAVQR
jgi:hypothetical protein